MKRTLAIVLVLSAACSATGQKSATSGPATPATPVSEPAPSAPPKVGEPRLAAPSEPPPPDCQARFDAFVAAGSALHALPMDDGPSNEVFRVDGHIGIAWAPPLSRLRAEQDALELADRHGLHSVAVSGSPALSEMLGLGASVHAFQCSDVKNLYLWTECRDCSKECGTNSGGCCMQAPDRCGPNLSSVRCQAHLRCDPRCCAAK